MESIMANYPSEDTEKGSTAHNEGNPKDDNSSPRKDSDLDLERKAGKSEKRSRSRDDDRKDRKSDKRDDRRDDRSDDRNDDKKHERRDERKSDRRDDRRDDRGYKRDAKRDDRGEDRRDDRDDRDDRRDDRRDKRDYKRDRETGFSKGGEFSSVPPPTYNAAPKGSSSTPLNLAQKKKLLWGNKKAESETKEETPTYNPAPAAPHVEPASVWADSKFTDDKRKEKFLQLMGAKKRKTEEEYDPLRPTSPPRTQPAPAGTTGDPDQDKLYNELEKQYNTSSSRRLTGTTLGLGF